MKEYRRGFSFELPAIFLVIGGLFVVSSLLDLEPNLQALGIFTFVILLIGIIAGFTNWAFSNDFQLDDQGLKFKTWLAKNWTSVRHDQIKECVYAGGWKRKTLYLRTVSPHEEYWLSINGMKELDDFRRALKEKLGLRYTENTSLIFKVSDSITG